MARTLVRLWTTRLVLAAAAIAAAASVHVPGAHPADSLALLAPAHPPADLPPALRVSLSHEQITLVSAIAADIDSDGDLDIVGSDDHLSLVVFVNDGQGHLSRRSSRQPRSLESEPDGPSVTDRDNGGVASVQSDPPTIAPDVAPGVDVVPAAGVGLERPDMAVAADLVPGVPRAPPAIRRS
jgi:hypothetical protein